VSASPGERFGATPYDGGVEFRVWAPARAEVDVVIESGARGGARHSLRKDERGVFAGRLEAVGAGDRYRYLGDGQGPFPDPASRFQPQGVHGSSEVVDASAFSWSDGNWAGLTLAESVFYELHVGTFTTAGTFAALSERLEYLADLGITAIELMPVADFPGERNWGYDGVALFAPARCYGRPEILRAMVDRAHALGLGVVLDVVYNHLGPDGNYLSVFSPEIFSARHQTPWGAAINLDGPRSDVVREFLIANALHWIREYHVDGLRLDATHALIDDGPLHFLAELSQRVAAEGRPALLIAEDHRNLATMVRPRRAGGWGLDAVWADDFHHQVRRAVAGDCEGYYRDFSGSMDDIASTLRRGWYYCGQYSPTFDEPRGTDPAALSPRCFVLCLQNHDQIGNRAFGDRLHHQIDAAVYRAASVLLLLAPQTPLLFMGQEWGASSPFLYFTDHEPALGARVTEGRRHEFRHFSAFRDAAVRSRIPDPQGAETFRSSQLRWEECGRPEHACLLRLYRALLRLRRDERREGTRADFTATAVDTETLALSFVRTRAPSALVVVRLAGAGEVDLRSAGASATARWTPLLTTEDEAFAPDPRPPRIELGSALPWLGFARPGAVVLRETGSK